jgi:hypothetical protein
VRVVRQESIRQGSCCGGEGGHVQAGPVHEQQALLRGQKGSRHRARRRLVVDTVPAARDQDARADAAALCQHFFQATW